MMLKSWGKGLGKALIVAAIFSHYGPTTQEGVKPETPCEAELNAGQKKCEGKKDAFSRISCLNEEKRKFNKCKLEGPKKITAAKHYRSMEITAAQRYREKLEQRLTLQQNENIAKCNQTRADCEAGCSDQYFGYSYFEGEDLSSNPSLENCEKECRENEAECVEKAKGIWNTPNSEFWNHERGSK